MKIEKSSIFSEQTLEELPAFYHFMTKFYTKELGELKIKSRFSKSEQHFSSNYLNYVNNKPFTDVNYIKRIDDYKNGTSADNDRSELFITQS